ncbi:hypothetical protein [Picosynechococcus sp. PCC 8807]|uniref:hypothetical protein n=1 Tax=Picosynechococcus sp. PCC 8807 TaxID=195248 RepID=UPI0008105824|nr:hypothetical protein [Picosynechococcus sp. PCC 8807]ANV89228.1 hypothetical protein AWQ24_00395 [Picosynechococcus sp. PCC 8807]
MSCENLVSASAFQSEIKKLKAEIAALKKPPQQASIDPKLLAAAVGTYFAGSSGKDLLDSLTGMTLERKLSAELKRRQFATVKQLDATKGSLERSFTKKINPLQRNINRLEGGFEAFKTNVNGRIGKIQNGIAKYADDVIKNSKLLTKLRGQIGGLLSKFGGLLRRIAPFLRFLDILITGISVYQLIQLTRRMSNAERAILAAQAGLSYATGRALFALTRINQVEAMNNRNAASIKALIRSEHRQTRNSVNGNVNREHTTTRSSVSAVSSTVRNQHNSTRSHVTYEHRVTRTGVSAVNTQVRNQHSSTRSHVTYEHRITRNAIFAIPARIGQSYQNISKEVVDWNKRNLLPKLNGIQSKLDQTYNKLVDRFNKLWDYMKMDRILNVINTAASVHNAAMLSRNLAASLLDTIGETLGIIGLKDPDGQAYNLNAILGRSAQDLIVGMIGQQAFNNLSEDWRNWNRIISAGAGVVMSLRNIQWAIAEGVENLNTWVARIGNGLEDDGVVTDRKWPWMRENVGITRITGLDKLTNTLESAEEITENIYATVASGQEIAESVTQLRQAKASFDQTLQTDETTQTTEQQTKETESESPTPSVDDLAEFEPEPEE